MKKIDPDAMNNVTTYAITVFFFFFFLQLFSESNLQVRWLSPLFHHVAIALLAAGAASNNGSKILHFAQNAKWMILTSIHKNSPDCLMHWLYWKTYSASKTVQYVLVLKLFSLFHFFPLE